MAKAARRVDRNEVKAWFSGLTFDVQQTVLDDLGKALEATKRDRILMLETELASLRGGTEVATARVDRRKGPSAKKGMKVEAKYRHPNTGETWSGRGVNPRWVREYLKRRGNKLEDLLINK